MDLPGVAVSEEESEAARDAAIEQFAAQLNTLRRECGRPSFRTMAKRSGCISHTTLYEASRGLRLPSWETTEQFVSACGADPEQWRARWAHVAELLEDHLTGPVPAVADPHADSEQNADVSEPTGATDETATGQARPHEKSGSASVLNSTGGSASRWRSRPVAVAAALGLLVGGGVGLATGAVVFGSAGSTSTAAPPASGAPGASDQSDGGSGAVADVAGPLEDVTLPDESVVDPGAKVDKVWRLSNAGGAEWSGRTLQRITPADSAGAHCITPDEVEIPNTVPGSDAEIHVPVTMPDKPGDSCRVEWKMVNADGSPSFPDSRPIYFMLVTAR